MNTKESFIKTLKEIGYHDIDPLNDSDLYLLMSEKEGSSFFEQFCTLNEKNFLTTEEIQEFASLTPENLAKIEAWGQNEQLCKNDVKHEEKEKLFLQEKLEHIENHNKSIERQLEQFKKYEESLLEEKEIQQNLLLNTKTKFQEFDMIKISKAKEFVSNLLSIREVAQDLEHLITHSDERENKLPTSKFFKDIVQQYLEKEEKLLQYVKTYLLTNFQLQEDETLLLIHDENSRRSELLKETSFLEKRLKKGMTDNILSEKEMKKIDSLVKYLEDFKTDEFNCPLSQLKFKLEDSTQLNQRLKKKEEELIKYISDAISKYVDALLTEVHLYANKESLEAFKFCVEKISLPMKILLQQRARVEMLFDSLCKEKLELQELEELLKRVLNEIEQERSDLEERKNLFENGMNSVERNEDGSNPEAVLLSSLFKILTLSDQSDDKELSEISITDVVQRADKIIEAKSSCAEKAKEKMKIVDLLEKHAYSVESLLNGTDQKYSNWHELEQELNANLNDLNMKLASLVGSVSKFSQDLDEKQKILERNGNLRLARSLYVYALSNNELFKKWMEDIKVAVENSSVH